MNILFRKAGDMMEVYLDNSATTRCFDEVAALMTRIMCEDYGNPSSLHRKGVEAEKYIRYAKEVIAKNLKVNEKEIFFTSGGTESDNLALRGCAYANCRSGTCPAPASGTGIRRNVTLPGSVITS